MMRFSIGRATGRAAGLVLALLAGCADKPAIEMTTRPVPGADQAAGAAQRKVVLFRAVLEAGGREMDAPWSLHLSGLRLFSVVGPANAPLSSLSSFEPGWPDAASSDNGWAFVALAPGAYQLAFEGMAMRFAMAGSQYIKSETTLPVGRSPPAVVVVPPDGGLFYIGTFNFSCERVMSSTESLRLECMSMAIRNEAELARQVAHRAFSAYEPMQEVPSVPAER
jgi:hypothetical protein